MKKILSVLLLAATIVSLVMILDSFKIKKISLNSDFVISKENVVKLLKIKMGKYVWEQNFKYMNSRLKTSYYIDEYDFNFSGFNTFSVKLKKREPLTNINSWGNEIYSVDKNGLIFKSLVRNYNIPLIVVSRNVAYKPGMKIEPEHFDIVSAMRELKDKRGDIYAGISQIEVYNSDYIVKFRAIDRAVYLKKNINVEDIYRGMAVVNYLEDRDVYADAVYETDNGFVYDKEQTN